MGVIFYYCFRPSFSFVVSPRRAHFTAYIVLCVCVYSIVFPLSIYNMVCLKTLILPSLVLAVSASVASDLEGTWSSKSNAVFTGPVSFVNDRISCL